MKGPYSWFSTLQELKDANTEYFAQEEREGVVLACDWGKKEPYTKKFRLFVTFEEAVEYVSEEVQSRLAIPSLYEYIGVVNSSQKPYFDIDIPAGLLDDPYSVSDELSRVLEKILEPLSTKNELKLCTYETVYYDRDDITSVAQKHSFHVVVDGLRFNCSDDMMAFGLKVKREMNQDLARFVDPIWTPLRQMRLLGSSKRGKFSAKGLYSIKNLHGKVLVSKQEFFSKDLLRTSMITEPKGLLLDYIP